CLLWPGAGLALPPIKNHTTYARECNPQPAFLKHKKQKKKTRARVNPGLYKKHNRPTTIGKCIKWWGPD
ncbi:hypothetical protein, partial [Enterobacter intestinihominis]